MTISSPSPHNLTQTSSSSSSSNLCQVRRNSLQSPSCIVPRRSSMSSISKVKTPASERFLQCIDKRRRYLRRGSKTSSMLRGSFRVELPNLNLDDSIHSSTSNSTWTSSSSSSRSLSMISLALSEADSASASALPSPKYMDMDASMHRRLRQEQRASPPFSHPDRRRIRKEATVSLLTSALALSSISDSNSNNGDAPSQAAGFAEKTPSTASLGYEPCAPSRSQENADI